MNKKFKNILIILAVILILGSLIFIWFWQESKPGKYDEFAKCLKDSGLTFYGTFWCPHCQNQKTLFGKSKKYLPYVECSTADSNGQLQVCKDANIQGYPTWQFKDGSRETGELSLKRLSEKSGCMLPQ